MNVVPILFAAIICVVSAATIVFPARLLDLLGRVRMSTGLRLLASVVRLVLGVLLILVAESTAYPQALKVIGVVLIVAGIAVLVMGNERLQALIDWFASRGPAVLRVGGAFALLFGLFLVYALI